MSIDTELENLSGTKSDIKAALNEQGVSVLGAAFSDTPDLIRQIQTSGGGALPLGMIFPSVGGLSDPRFKLLDGDIISMDGMYGEFCAYCISEINAGRWKSVSQAEFNADVNTYGECGKFVVDTSARTVRLPKVTRFIGAAANFTEVGKAYLDQMRNHAHNVPCKSATGAAVQTTSTMGSDAMCSNVETSGLLVDDGRPVTLGNEEWPCHIRYYYYIVVSTTGQMDEVQVNVNQIASDIALKADKTLSNISGNIDYVVDSWSSSDKTSWYYVYKSGRVVQGGRITSSGSSAVNVTINFPYPVKNTEYVFSGTYCSSNSTTNYYSYEVVNNRTTSSTVARGFGGYTINWLVICQ
jgi:hypothetical protein